MIGRVYLGSVLCTVACALGGHAEAADHSWEFSSRVRAVDATSGDESGRAASVLLRAQLASRWGSRWSSLVEVDHVSSAWRDEHSDGQRLNGKPLISDVPGTVLNQLALRYRGNETELTLGRQRIEWDDQRFVGSDSFWQQDQTFDALLAERRLLMSSRFNYAYIGRAQRIFVEGRGSPQGYRDHDDYGYDAPADHESDSFPGDNPYSSYSFAGEHRHESHLARLELNEWDYSQLVAYGHAIDNEDQPETSNYTLGVRYRFAYRAHPLRYRLLLETASQELRQESRESGNRPQPQYHLLELAMGYKSLEWIGRYEVLSSDEQAGFAFPLGSPYLFQGFAGVFAATPDAGVKDASVRVNWRAHPWELSTRFHHFSAQSGGGDYGRELDVELRYKLSTKHQVQLRYADFRAHPAAYQLVDQRRVFLDYRYNF